MEDIANYTAKDSVKFANITVFGIIGKAEQLENDPFIGRTVPEISDDKYRELIEGSYRIIYKVDNERINILTVHHSSQDLSSRRILSME